MPYYIEIEPGPDDSLHATLTHAETEQVIELDGFVGLDALWADIRAIVLAAQAD